VKRSSSLSLGKTELLTSSTKKGRADVVRPRKEEGKRIVVSAEGGPRLDPGLSGGKRKKGRGNPVLEEKRKKRVDGHCCLLEISLLGKGWHRVKWSKPSLVLNERKRGKRGGRGSTSFRVKSKKRTRSALLASRGKKEGASRR